MGAPGGAPATTSASRAESLCGTTRTAWRPALDDVSAAPLPALVVCHGGTIRCAFALRNHRGLDAFHELDVPNAVPLRLEDVSTRGFYPADRARWIGWSAVRLA